MAVMHSISTIQKLSCDRKRPTYGISRAQVIYNPTELNLLYRYYMHLLQSNIIKTKYAYLLALFLLSNSLRQLNISKIYK